MRKVTLSLLLAALSITASADKVELKEAQQMAAKFTTETVAAHRVKSQTDATLKLELHTSGLYVFNRGTDGGFVIVAANDNVEGGTILGFADQGHFDSEQMPAALKAWIDDVNDQVAYAALNPAQTPSKVVRKHTAVAPLCTSTWGQNSPYYNLTPIVNGGQSPTGCVATTMAQIMYKHKYPEHGIGTVTGCGETIDLAQQTYDWANMPDVLDGSSSNESIKAVATLMRDCGYSIRSNYGQTVTTANEGSVPDALINSFGYSQSICDIYRNSFTEGGWDEVIYNELANGRPVMLGGYNSEGGHNFLCDGYQDGKFHINWGWGGVSNGYFRMDRLTPSQQGTGGTSSGYNSNVEAIIGIQPATETTQYLDLVFNKNNFSTEQQTATRSDSVTFTGNFTQGTRATSLDFLLGVEVIDAEGNATFLPAAAKSTLSASFGGGFGGPNGGGPNGGNQASGTESRLTVSFADFPMATGSYILRPAFQGNDGVWREMYHSPSINDDVIAVVADEQITLSSAASAYEMAAEHIRISNVTPEPGAAIKVSATLKGVRGSYEGNLRLSFYQNGTKIGTGSNTSVVMEEGDERTYTLSANVPVYSGLTEVYIEDAGGNNWCEASCIVIGGKSNAATIQLTKVIEMPAYENVNKYDITVYATMTCQSGNYVGPVKVSVCGGKRYGTVLGMLTSDNYVIPEGKTVDIMVKGSIEALEDSTKYKVYLLDSNGAYFTGQSSLDNCYFVTGKNMTPPESEEETETPTDPTDPDEPDTPEYTGEYMLATQWGQDAPYSNLCPSKYPTGCTATAFAQVLRYWKYPLKGTGSITYTDNNGNTRTTDFSQSVYNWDAMLDKVKTSSPDSCKQAVALLMKDVGYASQMKYEAQESVAYLFNAAYGVATYLNYDKSICHILRNMYTDEEWNEIILGEIQSGRPVVYTGYASSTSGHTFVIDGYKEGKYHVNFGWDGMYDGYYTLDKIMNYNLAQEAVVSIKPYDGTSVFPTMLYNFTDFSVDESKSPQGNFIFRGEFANRSVEEKTFRYGLEFVDGVGNSTFVESTKDNTRAPLTYYTSFNVQPSLMPKATGSYLVYPAYRDSQRTWHRMHTDISYRGALVATINGASIQFSTDTTSMIDVADDRQPDVIYNLNGQRVAVPTKGLYIIDGRKVMVK